MKLNPKVTGGLAWAGLVLILAVPSADMLMKPQDQAATITSDMDAIRTASVTPKPAVATTPAAGDPVDSYIASGKKLPSYISDAPVEAASQAPVRTPKLVVPSTPAAAPGATLEVAALPGDAPEAAPPTPYPASMRPKAPLMTASVSSEAAPLILDEELVTRREQAVARVLDGDLVDVGGPDRFVRGDQLEEWDSGSLADYLERRGMLSEDRSQASASDYDPDGFFLDEGPNSDRRLIRRVRPRDFFFF
jgi:hypothetical protein